MTVPVAQKVRVGSEYRNRVDVGLNFPEWYEVLSRNILESTENVHKYPPVTSQI
jgi:hypothetical protein